MEILKRRGAVLALAALLGWPLFPAASQAMPDREHQVKAVFLYNFAQFVQWPDSAFGGPNGPLVVGILGQDPFDSYLDDVVRGEKVNDHPIQVKRFKRTEDIKGCHVLFIGDAAFPKAEAALASLKAHHVLTVGESDAFFRGGGMVCFATEGGRIRLKINLEAVQDADLIMSSKLLRLAEVSGSGKG